MSKKFAIFTTVSTPEDIQYAMALGKSLQILGVPKSAELNCVCTQEIKSCPELAQLTDTWSKIYANAPAEYNYLNVLTGHIYTNYTTVIYVDPHTVFFNSPVSLFNTPVPAAFFNSIYSSYMIKMYSDLLISSGITTDVSDLDYTMGHMHVYGQLKNNYPINYDIMRQAVRGVYAYITPDGIDPESQVRALNSKFMIFQPDSDFYIFVRDSPKVSSQFFVGSQTDVQIMTASVNYYDKCLEQGKKLPMWKNLVHNYRVPTQLIRAGKKPSIIYRKDTMEGLITAQLLIYGVEADLNLAKYVNSLSQFDQTKLSDAAPQLERVSYVSREHEEESKKLV
jgi:hypothetical protein